jgi:hypothetical protein
MFEEAKGAIVGTSTSSGIGVLLWVHDAIPILSTIGILAGTILAIHGVFELILKYIKRGKDD